MPLLAYTADGLIVATLDVLVARDEQGQVVGLVDFEEHERAGGALTEVWVVEGAAGSGTWPEWLATRAHDFRVELEPGWSRAALGANQAEYRIRALVHSRSGLRRPRPALGSLPAGADRRAVVGGPEHPLRLDDTGNTQDPGAIPPRLPLLGARRRAEGGSG